MKTLPLLIQENPIFSCLPPRDQELLTDRAIERSYREDDWITRYGDIWPYLFIVDSGEVKAVKESVEGRSLIVTNIQAGEMFWGLAFFNEDTPMWVGLQANQTCRIYLWSREEVLPLLQRNGTVMWELTQTLVRRMQRASDIVEELAFQPVTGRLAHLLLDHFGDDMGEMVNRDLTLDEMAARIGTTREMVCRQLYRFADMGVIQINRTEFMVLDSEQLNALAHLSKGETSQKV